MRTYVPIAIALVVTSLAATAQDSTLATIGLGAGASTLHSDVPIAAVDVRIRSGNLLAAVQLGHQAEASVRANVPSINSTVVAALIGATTDPFATFSVSLSGGVGYRWAERRGSHLRDSVYYTTTPEEDQWICVFCQDAQGRYKYTYSIYERIEENDVVLMMETAVSLQFSRFFGLRVSGFALGGADRVDQIGGLAMLTLSL
jgi:hypothetical protein